MKQAGVIINALSIIVLALGLLMNDIMLICLVFPLVFVSTLYFEVSMGSLDEEIHLLKDRVDRAEAAIKSLLQKEDEK